MESVAADTKNLQILEDFYRDLSTVDQRKIWLSAFHKAAVPLIAAAKSTAPVERGNLWRSIATKAVRDQPMLIVGSIRNTPYITKKGKLSKVWYGLLTEGGTKRGVQAKHWFANARRVAEPAMLSMITGEWYDSINRMIQRTNSKLK